MVLAFVVVRSRYRQRDGELVAIPQVGVRARVRGYRGPAGDAREVDVVDAGGVIVDEDDRRARRNGDGAGVEVQTVQMRAHASREVDDLGCG